MTAVAGRDHHAGTRGIARDPEVPVPGVAIQADAGGDDRSVPQRGEGRAEKRAQVLDLLRGHGSLRRFRMHGPPWSVPSDLQDPGHRVHGKAVVAGRLDLGAEDGESFGRERRRVLWREMEHGVSRGFQVAGQPGKRVRRPGLPARAPGTRPPPADQRRASAPPRSGGPRPFRSPRTRPAGCKYPGCKDRRSRRGTAPAPPRRRSAREDVRAARGPRSCPARSCRERAGSAAGTRARSGGRGARPDRGSTAAIPRSPSPPTPCTPRPARTRAAPPC